MQFSNFSNIFFKKIVSKKELGLIFLASLLSLSLSGYRFGTGDHLSQFPSVLYFFDHSLYQKDFPYQMIFPPYLKVGLHIVLFSSANLTKLPVEFYYFAVFVLILFLFFLANLYLLKWAGVKGSILEGAIYLLAPFSVFFSCCFAL